MIISRYFPIWQSQEMSHDFVPVNLWLKLVSATGATPKCNGWLGYCPDIYYDIGTV